MKRINFLATDHDMARLKALQAKLELTLTDVIRQAVRLLHKKEIDQVKNVLLVVALSVLAVSCGGQPRIPVGDPVPRTTPTPPPVAAAFNSYFNSSMIGQVWLFQNADASCTTTYHVNAPPPSNYYPAGSIVLNITKSSAACYWAYGTDQASVDFVLSPLIDGSFQSKGWVSYFPTVIPNWSPWHIYASQVQTPSGALTPYMIVPPPTLTASSSIVMETSYNRWDFGGQNFNSFVTASPAANVYWKTSFYMQGANAVSEQWEGTCGHEKWTFSANRGLIALEFPNDTSISCTPLSPSNFITRIN